MKILILALLLLFGCASNPSVERVKTVEVKVPVSVPCKITPVDKPVSPLERLSKEDDVHTKVKTILAYIEQQKGYEKQLEAAIKECQ